MSRLLANADEIFPVKNSRIFAEDASWYEGDHKRDKGGKFAKTASNGETIDDSKVEKLHNEIKAGAANKLGNKAKSKLSEIGKAHKGQMSWSDVSPIEGASTELHHNINAYIKHHKEGSGVTPPASDPGSPGAVANAWVDGMNKKTTPTTPELSAITKSWIDNLGGEEAALSTAMEMLDDDTAMPEDIEEAEYIVSQLGAKLYPKPSDAPVPEPPKSMMSEKTTKIAQGIKDNMDKVTPGLKPAVEAKIKEINAAIDSKDKVNVAMLEPIPNPVGMMQKAVNEYIASMHDDLGIKPVKPNAPPKQGYNPSPAQQEKATKLNAAPAKRIDSNHYYEDAGGVEIKSTLKANTKDIPEGFYGKVTAAYNGNHDHGTAGQLSHIDPVMEQYASHVFDKLLTSEEVSSSHAYQNGAYDGLNKATAGLPPQPPSEYTKKTMKNMSAAIAKSPLPADTPVFRGINASLKDITGFDDPNEAVGRCFEHKGFASCSRSQAKSKGFSGGKVMLKFHVPAGAKALVMKKQNWEREIVLDKSSMFRVDKVEKGANGVQHFLHVTYLGQRASDNG